MLLIGVLDVRCTATKSCRAEVLVHRFAKQRLTFAAWKVKVKFPFAFKGKVKPRAPLAPLGDGLEGKVRRPAEDPPPERLATTQPEIELIEKSV